MVCLIGPVKVLLTDTEKNFQNVIFRCRVLLHERQFRVVLTFFEDACFSFILHSEVS